jgi:hypothetical protein
MAVLVPARLAVEVMFVQLIGKLKVRRVQCEYQLLVARVER